jgi:hypothetical protein
MREEQWEIFKVVYWYHKEVPQFFFEFCCGITEKIDVDDWTKRN